MAALDLHDDSLCEEPVDEDIDEDELGVGEDDEEPVAPATPESINFTNPQTVFVVTGVAKCQGGFRPAILFDGFLAELVQDGVGATLKQLQLMQGSEFLYLIRGLPKTLLHDYQSLAFTWGQVHAVFRAPEDLARFITCIKHVEMKEEALWSAAVARAWLGPTAQQVDGPQGQPGAGAAANGIDGANGAGPSGSSRPTLSPSSFSLGEYCDQVMARVNRLPQPLLLAVGSACVAAASLAVYWLRARKAASFSSQ